jgi:hypothetical protein
MRPPSYVATVMPAPVRRPSAAGQRAARAQGHAGREEERDRAQPLRRGRARLALVHARLHVEVSVDARDAVIDEVVRGRGAR